MKKIWNSFLIAFAMFSKIPVPRADWDKENMRYMMCFFPLIGVVMPEHAEQSEESCRNHFNRIRVETTKEFWRTFCEKEHPQESLWLHVDPADVMVLR